MRARRPVAALGLVALGLLSTGCSWYYDAYVVNPCPHQIRIETYDDPPQRFDDHPPNRGLFLEPESMTFVGGAFYDPEGHWSLRVIGLATPLRVEKDGLKDDTIEAPADICSFAWQPETP